ncbi:MAG TPA: hypothetical protein PK079_07065 [Leptospiraceae bacterium]|nr:hypothetical protein [Leptospiraceae bacterium]HMW05964.1 hypothetical protein [Leptospiraceae bacterium]HMX32104.1 hypothetical protein [Leptospiraceae bacterium]HMY32318.1 hypothetical protein [Leptospiraceae bacterium]HMZ62480.1 hypothetical protein [Leptospiraceae bacterium]
MSKEISQEEIESLFKEFYLLRRKISGLCGKYNISRYQFYKLKKNYSKKSYYDYSLEEWVHACLKTNPNASPEEIRKYLSYVNKTEYTIQEIEIFL